MPVFDDYEKTAAENNVGTRENADNISFFSFALYIFYPVKDKFHVLSNNRICCLQMLSIWTVLKCIVGQTVEYLSQSIVFKISLSIKYYGSHLGY